MKNKIRNNLTSYLACKIVSYFIFHFIFHFIIFFDVKSIFLVVSQKIEMDFHLLREDTNNHINTSKK